MERADAIQAGDDSVTSSVIQGKFSRAHLHERADTGELENLSVSDELRAKLMRSRIFGRIGVTGAQGVTLHRGILRVVSEHLRGRHPMASTDGQSVTIDFQLDSHDPNNATTVQRFANGVAMLMGPEAHVVQAQVMQFDTSDLDPYLLPENRSE